MIAPLFQLFFALTLHWFPVGGWGGGAFVNKVGPVLTLMLPQLAIVARLMRGSMIESLHAHHIRTARALGLSDYSVVIQACAPRRASSHRILCRSRCCRTADGFGHR